MLLNQHLKIFIYLNQLQLICIFFKISKIKLTTSFIRISLSYSNFSNFILLLNWGINWIIIKIFSINFNVVIFNFYARKKIYFERINRNFIITCCIIISKNKQCFNSLITWIKEFYYEFLIFSINNLYCFIINHVILVPINRSFKSFTLLFC